MIHTVKTISCDVCRFSEPLPIGGAEGWTNFAPPFDYNAQAMSQHLCPVCTKKIQALISELKNG